MKVKMYTSQIMSKHGIFQAMRRFFFGLLLSWGDAAVRVIKWFNGVVVVFFLVCDLNVELQCVGVARLASLGWPALSLFIWARTADISWFSWSVDMTAVSSLPGCSRMYCAARFSWILYISPSSPKSCAAIFCWVGRLLSSKRITHQFLDYCEINV